MSSNNWQKDPRYEFRTETLRSWLGPLITPSLESQLIALGPPKSAAERAAVRSEREKARSRVKEGRYSQTRTEYSAKAAERAQQAQELRESGLSQKAIAEQLGTTQGRVSQLLKCAPLV